MKKWKSYRGETLERCFAYETQKKTDLKKGRTVLTVSQVAERLNVSPATIYSLVTEGRISCHRIGLRRGTLRFTEEQLLAFLEENKQEGAGHKTPPPKHFTL